MMCMMNSLILTLMWYIIRVCYNRVVFTTPCEVTICYQVIEWTLNIPPLSGIHTVICSYDNNTCDGQWETYTLTNSITTLCKCGKNYIASKWQWHNLSQSITRLYMRFTISSICCIGWNSCLTYFKYTWTFGTFSLTYLYVQCSLTFGEVLDKHSKEMNNTFS